jgi:cytochrome c oxidase subunit 5a
MLRRQLPNVRRLLSTHSTGATGANNVKEQQPGENEQFHPGHDPHHYGTVENFERHWTAFFAACPDTFELQRGLNNCFNYDLVPTVKVVEAALLAARRLNSFATGGLRGKVASEWQYQELKAYFKPLMEASGLCAPEDLGRLEY